jgi:hypothetical protein
MGIVTGRASPLLEGHMVVPVFLKICPDALVAWIAIVCPCFNQLKIVIACVLVMACKTPPLCKRLMDAPAGNLIEHALMAIETDLVFSLNQELPVVCRVGAVADHTPSDTNRRVHINAVKERLLFVMAGVTLFHLGPFEFKFFIGSMGVVACYADTFLYRVVNT